ncbi:Altered inheritance of mitochondria protein 18 mitochondrial [Cladophialophora chaetospira]|uniref:Altered inheritance of mitochondria protein 18 mitochondrial n=1 Tax=Cladophialophora chaetospira TaxID=386627 RepID=A0AA38X8D5_9EURO|nr:Altered inheritance of mitochondria protein 18 mitochondrial [Cladophialophora chaetospira]
MQASPLRALVSKRVCNCKVAQQQLSRPANPQFIRLLSSSTRQHVQSSFSSPVPSYGSSEMLRRKYQKSEPSNTEQEKAERARTIKRMRYSGYGIAACTVAIIATVALYPSPNKKQSTIKLDAPPPPTPSTVLEEASKKEVEQVPTGTSTIPSFPRIIHISADAPSSSPGAANEGKTDEEYQLVGLGIRTVSILSIQVYVVGLYVAISDIASLQQRLVNAVVPPSESVASTLVPGEKDQLRQLLLDPKRGEDIWDEILKDGQIRTAFRIVPTRNTDFMHLRDGFDESFGAALNDFKSAFGGSARRKLPKGEILLLARDGRGKLGVWEETSKTGDRVKMGDIVDERVGRLLWLGYLAGSTVSSEPARQNVVEGCMQLVERPVGTVATQVV